MSIDLKKIAFHPFQGVFVFILLCALKERRIRRGRKGRSCLKYEVTA